jgi:hypothetical protein
MKYKPWIIVFLVFAGLSVTADYVFTHWAIYNNPSSYAGRIYHLYHENGDEIPMFGASKVLNDYIPTEMGINAYNYGLNDTSYETIDVFLQIELAKPKTSPIIIDLKPAAEYGIGDPIVYVPFVFDPRIRKLMERSGSLPWRYYLPGIRYFGCYDLYLEDLINDHFHLMRKVVRGFSYEKYRIFDRTRLDAAIRMRLQGTNGYFPDESQNRRLIGHIQAHPERLFFLVYSPVHSTCYVNFQHLNQFNAFKAQLASFPNAVVIDYSQLNFPDEWFKDTTHLLTPGAEEFSRRLGAKINEVLLARNKSSHSN